MGSCYIIKACFQLLGSSSVLPSSWDNRHKPPLLARLASQQCQCHLCVFKFFPKMLNSEGFFFFFLISNMNSVYSLKSFLGKSRDECQISWLPWGFVRHILAWKSVQFLSTLLVSFLSRWPSKNNSEEEKFILGSQFQRFSPWLANSVTLGQSWGRENIMAGHGRESCSPPGNQEAEKALEEPKTKYIIPKHFPWTTSYSHVLPTYNNYHPLIHSNY